MKDAIVVGRGMVGRATMNAFGIDKYYSKSSSNVNLDDIPSFKYIFLCLPTPTVDGLCDTSAIDYYINKLKVTEKNIFIIRSTVIPGTCRRLAKETQAKIVHVPEFLSEDTWEDDSTNPDLVVIGGDDPHFVNDVLAIMKSRYTRGEFITTDSMTAEMIKYSINVFYATKVVLANQLYDYCQEHEINYETVKQAMYKRKFIDKNHLDVWSKGGRGAGGKCLDKDLEAFAYTSKLSLFEEANKLNKYYLKNFPKHGTKGSKTDKTL